MLAKVAANEKAAYEEFPLNDDGSITITVLRKTFPNCVGIRYRLKPGGNLRGIKVYGDHLHLPVGVSWSDNVFFCVYEDVNEYEEEIDIEKERCLLEKYKLETYDMIALGLPDSISDDSFYQYFSKFGKLKLCELKKGRRDTKSKGYGFLRYMDFTDQSVCMRTEHIISGAEVALRLPTTKMDSATCKKKLFVTSITPSVTMDDILEYFSIFGKINQIFMPPIDPPYAFVTFDVEESIERILRFGDSHRIFGGYVVVERVYTKDEIREMNKVKSDSESVKIEKSFDRNENEPHFDDRDTFSNDEQSANAEHGYRENERMKKLQFELDQQFHHHHQQQQQQQQQQQNFEHQQQQSFEIQQHQNFEHQHQQQNFEFQYPQQPNFEIQQHFEHQQHQQQQPQPITFQNSQFLQQPPSNYENQNDFPIQNEHQYQTYPSNNHEYPVDNYQYSPNENYPDYPHHVMNHGNVGRVGHQERYCQETPSEVDRCKVSGVASRIVEQMSAQNEKDILIRLLIEQLSSSSRCKAASPSNSPDKLAKAMQLLQNPNILDNFIRFSESLGPDGEPDRKSSRFSGDRDAPGRFHRNPDPNS